MAKKKYKYQDVLDAVVQKLCELPSGTVVTTSEIMEMLYSKMNYTQGEYDYGTVAFSLEEYLEFHYQVCLKARKRGLEIDDSPSEGMKIGLLFHCQYRVLHK